MTASTRAAAFLIAASLFLPAQLAAATPAAPPTPQQCLHRTEAGSVESASAGGKTYYFRQPGCRDLFLSDPERYGQLFDALLELEREGIEPPVEPEQASLVPS